MPAFGLEHSCIHRKQPLSLFHNGEPLGFEPFSSMSISPTDSEGITPGNADSSGVASGMATAPVNSPLRRRVAGRLLPYLFLIYLVAFLDRVNLAYAAPGMAHDLGFNARQLGLGMGVFFWGYLLLEI